MNANPILMQKKYTRIVSMFAKEKQLTLDAALHFFTIRICINWSVKEARICIV